jgi:hypothetical protein
MSLARHNEQAARRECIMTVAELIEILSELEPSADVFLVHDEARAVESELRGVTTREEAMGTGAQALALDGRARYGSPEDVLLVQGDALGYGTADAWDVT